jgi:hypothetical protein
MDLDVLPAALDAVAKYLLTKGLRGKEGVVFLDEQDRRMILVRASMKVMPLQNSGIPESERFVFYDQVRLRRLRSRRSSSLMFGLVILFRFMR